MPALYGVEGSSLTTRTAKASAGENIAPNLRWDSRCFLLHLMKLLELAQQAFSDATSHPAFLHVRLDVKMEGIICSQVVGCPINMAGSEISIFFLSIVSRGGEDFG